METTWDEGPDPQDEVEDRVSGRTSRDAGKDATAPTWVENGGCVACRGRGVRPDGELCRGCGGTGRGRLVVAR